MWGTDEGSKLETLSGIAQATAALTRLKPVWNDRSISLSSKVRLMRSLVTSIFLYACESWILTAELRRRIQAMEMRCYRKILRISYKDHVTNEKSVFRSSRQSDHTKTSRSLQRDADCGGMVMSPVHQVWLKPSCKAQRKVGRRQDRQRKRWEDNIREWTGLEFAKSQRAVENRENGGN